MFNSNAANSDNCTKHETNNKKHEQEEKIVIRILIDAGCTMFMRGDQKQNKNCPKIRSSTYTYDFDVIFAWTVCVPASGLEIHTNQILKRHTAWWFYIKNTSTMQMISVCLYCVIYEKCLNTKRVNNSIGTNLLRSSISNTTRNVIRNENIAFLSTVSRRSDQIAFVAC